jgi:hypothetical protein
MTLSELKKAIKALKKRAIALNKINPVSDEDWRDYEKQKELICVEFKRLYFANSDFSGLDSKSILTLLKMNVKYRFIEFHLFGIKIDLEKL